MKHVYLVRHSTTADGKNDVRGSKMATALAMLAGAFFPVRKFAAAFSSPQQRATETGEIFLISAGVAPEIIQVDGAFDEFPQELKTPERMAQLKEICAATGITTEEAIFLPAVGLQEFIQRRGATGFDRITEIIESLPDESNVVVFTHGGSVIEPIVIMAQRCATRPPITTAPFGLTEIQGAVAETGAYRLDFDNGFPVKVEQVRMPNSIKKLVQRAKKERL